MAFRISSQDDLNQINMGMAQKDQERARKQLEEAQRRADSAKQAPTGLFGALQNVATGIGEKVGDLGATLGNIVNTVVAGSKQIDRDSEVKQIQERDSQRRNEIARKYGYNSYAEAQNDDNASQDMWDEMRKANEQTQQERKEKRESYDNNYFVNAVKNTDLNKAKGQALSSIGTVFDVAPGLGVAGNAISGAFEGVGDAYKQAEGRKEDDIDLDQALKNIATNSASAIAGGAASPLTGKLVSKLPNGGRGIIGAAAQGAMGGAISGATAGATNSFLNGGNIEDIAGSAGQGLIAGAQGGAIMGAGQAGLAKGADALNKKIRGIETETPQRIVEQEPTKQATEPTAQDTDTSNMSYEERVARQKMQNQIQQSRDNAANLIAEQYGTVRLKDNDANINDAILDIADLGLTQRAEIDNFTNSITGRDGKVSKLVRNTMVDAGDVDTGIPITMQSVYEAAGAAGDISAQKRIDKLYEGQQAKYKIENGKMSRADMYDLGRALETEAYKDLKYGKLNSNNTRLASGEGLRILANELIDKATDGVNLKSKLTPAEIADLKDVLPGNQKWANRVDEFAQNATTIRDARKFMQSATQLNKYAEAARFNQGTYGQNMGNATLPTSKGQIKDRLVSMIVGSDTVRDKRVKSQLKKANNMQAQLDSGDVQIKSGMMGKAKNTLGNATELARNVGSKATNAISNFDNAFTGVDANISGLAGALNRAAQTGYTSKLSEGFDNQREYDQAMQQVQAAQDVYDLASQQYNATQQSAMTSQIPEGLQRSQNQLMQITDGMQRAMAAGDYAAYSQLADLYKDAYSIYEMQNQIYQAQNPSSEQNLSSKAKSAINDIDNSMDMLNQIEQAYEKAGGAQGAIGGNFNEFMNTITGGNANANLDAYNALKESLGTAIVKNFVNLGSTEADAKRYLAMLPSATDSKEQASEKLANLRATLENARKNAQNL